jgi:hypothetical protein
MGPRRYWPFDDRGARVSPVSVSVPVPMPVPVPAPVPMRVPVPAPVPMPVPSLPPPPPPPPPRPPKRTDARPALLVLPPPIREGEWTPVFHGTQHTGFFVQRARLALCTADRPAELLCSCCWVPSGGLVPAPQVGWTDDYGACYAWRDGRLMIEPGPEGLAIGGPRGRDLQVYDGRDARVWYVVESADTMRVMCHFCGVTAVAHVWRRVESMRPWLA